MLQKEIIMDNFRQYISGGTKVCQLLTSTIG